MSAKRKTQHVSSLVASDTIVEMVYNRQTRQTQLGVYQDKDVTYRDSMLIDDMHENR